MTASVTVGRALRYAEGSARGLLHHHWGHGPTSKWLARVESGHSQVHQPMAAMRTKPTFIPSDLRVRM